MTDTNQTCPQGLQPTTYSIRSCGRAHYEFLGYSTVIFPVNGSQYTEVCGRITAYQWGWYTSAFNGYNQRGLTIDGDYLDGISLTHGSPRTHIWSFALGYYNGTREQGSSNVNCPCDPGNGWGTPPYVGNDYFCDTAATVDDYVVLPDTSVFYSNSTLWDGTGCEGNVNQCCRFNNPPWFYKTLPEPTTDDIEFRMCLLYYVGYIDIAVELVEIYVR